MSAIVNFNQNEGLFVIASVYCKKKDANIVQAVKKCYKIKIDYRDSRSRFLYVLAVYDTMFLFN